MAVRELPRVKTKQYTVNDVWALECDPANEGRYFYLIDGELHEDPMPNWTHSKLAALFAHLLLQFVLPRNIGEVTVEAGMHPHYSRRTLLMPDIAFIRSDRLPDLPPEVYMPAMPDIAVEIKSPSNSMTQLRRKARTYLQHGTTLVWLVLPAQSAVEEWEMDDEGQMQQGLIGRDGKLDGGTVLPGFTLELSLFFPLDTQGANHGG